jgi:hypothetical protein
MTHARCALYAGLLIAQLNATAAAQPKITPGPPKIAPKSTEPRPSKEGVDFFEKKIRPVLVKNCYKCHSGDPAKAKGHFVLDTHAGLIKGGDSGEVISPGHPDKSLLIEAVKYEGLEMPPDGQLPDEEVEDLEKWVQMGAPDPRVGKAANPKNKIDLAEAKRYWAFQRPKASSPPRVSDSKWPISDIDRLILARLEKEHLKPVHDADPVTLIRRVTFDLTGLPPTPEEIDAFLSDKSAGAFATVVDRLLDSPRYGERWGRHWLDVVRFAESTGKERNVPYRYAWRYRDYVIDSFNADKPYDKFIVEQLAGDLIQARNVGEHKNDSLTIATGFLAIGPKSAVQNNPEQFKVDVIDDQIDVTGRAFLGMTIACARCHDHKFDPIPQTDYYAIAGIFHSTETFAGIQPGRRTATETKLLKLAGDEKITKTSDDSKEQKEREQEIAKIDRQLDDLHKQLKEANKKPPNPKNAKAARGKMPVQQPPANKPKIDQKAVRDQIKKLEDRLDELESQVSASGNLAIGVRDADSPADFHVLVRGELKEKGPEVPRSVLTVLKTPQTAHIAPKHSGRMELAHWIADKNNPLTARVMVNRVWEHLFGEGLVNTVDNFGALGNEPTHPELLDTLAVQFMDQKWSIKRLIRSIVLSRVYQLSSEHNDDNYEKDPGDKFLWRMPRRRLDAEEIRDAMLMASGQLSLERPEGSPVMELSNRGVGGGKGMQQVRKPSNVRSVYLPILRGLVPEMLGAFDVADPDLIVGKRDVTTVPTQALFLMNNPFVLNQSAEFAKRVLKDQGLDQNARINLAYRLAVGRLPTDRERTEVAKYIVDFRKSFEEAKQKGNSSFAAWASFCQTLFESGLFRYVY